jgi:hypothetical protein
VLPGKLRQLGPAVEPTFLKDRRDVRVGEEALKSLLIPVEHDPGPRVVIRIAETCEPWDPCCLRFSAPLVENAFQKRSKSSNFEVAKITSVSFR